MCGIAGFYSPFGLRTESATSIAGAMATAISHRGPDGEGVWVDGEHGIALGHRRLAVLDLSIAGHQPMTSMSGRFVVAFNGEIYNHNDIRKTFPHYAWRGHSDTETLLASIEQFGLAATLGNAVGMFAIALWDRHLRELTLVRDRMGEKPLYYGWQGSTFLFGSELKAFRSHPDFHPVVDRDVLPLYLQHMVVPAPHSIFRGIRKLYPGTFVTVSAKIPIGTLPEPIAYWSMEDVAVAGHTNQFEGNDSAALSELEIRLVDSVNLQRAADVPLGAFLSGGIDSSLVVATMQAQSSRPVKTFTIGFQEPRYNEAGYAHAVARHLNTDHHELYVTHQDSMAVIPRLAYVYDEPFADSSQIPSILVSTLAKQHVTVALSGDGGDELFGGYDRYSSAARLWRNISRIPLAGRKILGATIEICSPRLVGALCDEAKSRRGREAGRSTEERLRALAEALHCSTLDQFYARFTSQWGESIISESEGKRCRPSFLLPVDSPQSIAVEEKMMFADAVNYLPNDILVKLDRAAMAVSLESRIPLLDHRLVEFAWSLPLHFKIRNGEGKWLLRQLLYKYVPKKMVDRPKMGFGVPIDCWLRGPLKEWADDLMSEERLNRDGFFKAAPIRRRWRQHLSGQANWRDSLWAVLMFQSWLDKERQYHPI